MDLPQPGGPESEKGLAEQKIPLVRIKLQGGALFTLSGGSGHIRMVYKGIVLWWFQRSQDIVLGWELNCVFTQVVSVRFGDQHIWLFYPGGLESTKEMSDNVKVEGGRNYRKKIVDLKPVRKRIVDLKPVRKRLWT